MNRILETGECYLERKSDLAVVMRTKNQLMEDFLEGDLVLHGEDVIKNREDRCKIDLAGLSQEKQLLVMRKYHYVKEAYDLLGGKPSKNDLNRVIERVSERLSDSSPPSVSSVYRWWRVWLDNDSDILAFVNRMPGKEGVRKFRGTVDQEINKVVDDIYLTCQRNSKQTVYNGLVFRINSLNAARKTPLQVPSRSSFYRILAKLNKHEVMAAREGKRVADKTFRATGMGPSPSNILERIEVDHTPLDMFVFNPITGLADGRPFLTLLLDRYSRIPLGFEVGFENPSELSVMRALRNSILPKTDIKKEYPDIKNEWPAFGNPVMLVCDNGLEFHSKQLRRMCWELDIDLQFCPKMRPEYKGAVERFLGTLNRQVCHRLPGTTFSDTNHRGEYDSVGNAVITLSDVKELIYEWIVDIYCQQTHKATQRTPYSLWNEGLNSVEPRLPESKEKLNLILTSEDVRQLTHKGIEFKGLFYNSSELALIRRQIGSSLKVKFRFDKENMGYVWVYDEVNGDYLKVLCIDPQYAEGLTLRQHLLIRGEARAQGISDQNIEDLTQSRERFRKKIKEKSRHKLVRERRKAARDNSEALQIQIKTEAWSSNSMETSDDQYQIDDWEMDVVPCFSVTEKGDGR